jgi:hypothetical protein
MSMGSSPKSKGKITGKTDRKSENLHEGISDVI